MHQFFKSFSFKLPESEEEVFVIIKLLIWCYAQDIHYTLYITMHTVYHHYLSFYIIAHASPPSSSSSFSWVEGMETVVECCCPIYHRWRKYFPLIIFKYFPLIIFKYFPLIIFKYFHWLWNFLYPRKYMLTKNYLQIFSIYYYFEIVSIKCNICKSPSTKYLKIFLKMFSVSLCQKYYG